MQFWSAAQTVLVVLSIFHKIKICFFKNRSTWQFISVSFKEIVYFLFMIEDKISYFPCISTFVCSPDYCTVQTQRCRWFNRFLLLWRLYELNLVYIESHLQAPILHFFQIYVNYVYFFLCNSLFNDMSHVYKYENSTVERIVFSLQASAHHPELSLMIS